MPQESIARWVVPIPKQMTSPFSGFFDWKAFGRCTIILVIGVRFVIPTPLTKSRLFSRSVPVATIVAVLSLRTSRGEYRSSDPFEAKTAAADPNVRRQQTSPPEEAMPRFVEPTDFGKY